MRHAQKVGVVGTGQTFVGGNDDHANRADFAFFEQRMLKLTHIRREHADEFSHCLRIRFALLDALLNAPQLSCRHQLHRLRNLRDVFYAANF